MTESGDPKENAQAERINNTIKNERPHMSIDMMTPSEAATCSGEIEKKMEKLQAYRYKN